MNEAIAEVSRQTGWRFELADPEPGEMRVGGYVSPDPEAFIALMSSKHAAKATATYFFRSARSPGVCSWAQCRLAGYARTRPLPKDRLMVSREGRALGGLSMRRTLLSLFAALAIVSAAQPVQAQTGGSLLAGLTRPGGPVAVGAPVNYSWTAPTGMYFVTATVSYALQSTRTDTGGGVAAVRCNVHRGAGAIDISMASIGAGPTWANNASGEMTLSGRLSVTETSAVVTVTCQNVGNARSSVRIDHLQLHLVPVGGFSNLAVAP